MRIKRLSVAFPERYKKYQRWGSGHEKRGKRETCNIWCCSRIGKDKNKNTHISRIKK